MAAGLSFEFQGGGREEGPARKSLEIYLIQHCTYEHLKAEIRSNSCDARRRYRHTGAVVGASSLREIYVSI